MLRNIIKRYLEIVKMEEKKVVKVEVNAVFDEDLVPFLKSIEMYEPITKGEVKCSVCGNTISLDNILSIYPEEGEIKVCCSSMSCYNTMINKGAS